MLGFTSAVDEGSLQLKSVTNDLIGGFILFDFSCLY